MSESDRREFLTRVGIEDEGLRREAESLLAADQTAGDFLNGGAFELGLEVLVASEIRRHGMQLLSVGDLLNDRYEILAEITDGGMGNVYKAKDHRLGWTVAVKVLKEDALKNRWIVEKFRHEKEALARIDHPNVVRLVDAGELPKGAPYLVMKYVEGSDLSKILAAEGGLEPLRVAAIMQQAAQGVAALHEAGLVHRDIKPGNFVLSDNDREFPLKVIDFGIVRVLGTSTRLDQIPGTPPYLSPEQLSGHDVTSASDVYALAVTAYELLTGRPLFASGEMAPKEFLLSLCRWQREVSERTPQALLPQWPEAARVILRALSLDPSRRPEAFEFGNELLRALTADNAAAASAVLSGQPSSKARAGSTGGLIPNKRWLIAASILLVVILAVVLWPTQNPVRPTPGNAITITPPGPIPDSRPERALTYWLTVVRERDGKTIRADGSESFDTGDKFRIHFVPAQAGALYIFNQGTSGTWHTLFPTRKTHQSNPWLKTDEKVVSIENEFTAPTGLEHGNEKIWIVWALQPVPRLNELVKQSSKSDLKISDGTQQALLRQFMNEHASAQADADETLSQVTLKGRDEIMIHQLSLRHKDWK